jgi:hypothetical protein
MLFDRGDYLGVGSFAVQKAIEPRLLDADLLREGAVAASETRDLFHPRRDS